MNALIEQAAQHWQFVSPLLRKPENEADYDQLVEALDELTDRIGDDESHPLMSLVDIIGDWVEAYDLEHRPMPKVSGVDVLRSVMQEHGLNQSDLPGVGTQSADVHQRDGTWLNAFTAVEDHQRRVNRGQLKPCL